MMMREEDLPFTFDNNPPQKPDCSYTGLKCQVVLLQTAYYWANAWVLLGGRMQRERGSFRNN